MMFSEKLGNCQVCETEPAKYTCPRCELRTCSLQCVNNHKVDMKCNGLRDKTAYKPISKFTNLDFLSDYRLLEDISQSVDTFARDQNKRYTRSKGDLPKHLFLLREAAHYRDMRLWFLPHNFSRHKENTTYLDWKTKVVSWRVQWLFPDAEDKNTQMVDKRLCETTVLKDCIVPKIAEKSSVVNYHDAGIDKISLLLRAENRKNASTSFFLLDMNASLKENLKGHTLVEFPVVRVVLTENLNKYTLISLDDKREETHVETATNKREDMAIAASTSSKISLLPDSEESCSSHKVQFTSTEASSKISKITVISESEQSTSSCQPILTGSSKITMLPDREESTSDTAKTNGLHTPASDLLQSSNGHSTSIVKTNGFPSSVSNSLPEISKSNSKLSMSMSTNGSSECIRPQSTDNQMKVKEKCESHAEIKRPRLESTVV